MTHFVVSPAFGRDYRSASEARKAWQDGQDFIHESRLHTGGGTYINRDDVPAGSTIEIRFQKLESSTILTHKD